MDKNHHKNSAPTSAASDSFLTLNEVCQYLKISKSTIYKLSEQGKIPSAKIGKQLRFRKSSLDRWLSEKEKQALPIYTTTDKASAKPKNILLIDDDPLVLKSVSKLLKSHGYEVELAASGEEALEKARKSNFNLLIADIRMPGMDGIETIKRIRHLNASARRPAVPEIIITGYIDTNAQKEAAKLGINDYLYKPFSISDFINAVQKN
jgi:excisionase family DNA binding protein